MRCFVSHSLALPSRDLEKSMTSQNLRQPKISASKKVSSTSPVGKIQLAMITIQFQKFDHMLQGLAYDKGNSVAVAYICPVVEHKFDEKIVFVLVLETRKPWPEKYDMVSVNELFDKQDVPGEITFRKEKEKI
jgi:hypothetical protein